jgi:hypothetical protein
MKAFISSRIGIALSLAIVIILIAVAAKSTTSPKSASKNNGVVIDELVLASLDRDDDNDGLKNWEEDLYKTDPTNPDTDGDGLSDNAEALLGQDPTVAEPVSTSTEPATKTNFTATDKLSQEIFIKYVEMKQLGLEIDDSLSSQIAESILVQDYSDIKPVYEPSDIKILSNTSLVNLKNYGNSLGKALSAPPVKGDHELVIFQNLSGGQIETFLPQLEAQKSRYKAMLGTITQIHAPTELTSAHADISNAITLFISAIDGAKELETDPIGALSKIAAYEYGVELLKQSFSVYDLFFSARGVTFSSSEAGSIFSE